MRHLLGDDFELVANQNKLRILKRFTSTDIVA